ncbi:hypothetical protein JCM8097_006514 [Rhodosporidiobolus ruineniae]
MRSLTLLSAAYHPLFPSSSSSSTPASHLVATTLDPATDTTYAVALAPPAEGDDELILELYRLETASSSSSSSAAEPTLLTLFSTPLPSSSFFSPSPADLVVSFHYQAEDDALALVLANGEVEQVFLNGGMGEARRENVGTFDTGIKAASWSPDDELLAIVTGDNQLLLLTRTFDPLSESPLHTSSFGVHAPVSVGWGRKSTQFHGSLGKTAAAAAARADPMDVDWIESPLDDGRTRIVWRGDSSWFAVSSVEVAPPRSSAPDGPDRRVRRVRIYARSGEHSSTSEPVPGLEGQLAWMPSGEILAAVQRRVLPPPLDAAEGAQEKVELHVVFFERNGLRRYDFPLRENAGDVSAGRVRVKELGWNAGSDVLAVWIERKGEGDVVQLYHRSNYHWCLKQSLSASLAPSSRLTSPGFSWHPESPLSLSLLTPSGISSFSLAWDTFASTRRAPEDDGTVAVVDGAGLKLTPFRVLNVPPPMAGLVLCLPSAFDGREEPPVHVAFAPALSLSPSSSASSEPTPLHCAALSPSPSTRVTLYSWALPLPRSPKQAQDLVRAGLPTPVVEWKVDLHGEGVVAKQCAVFVSPGGEVTVAVLRSTEGGDEVVLVGKEGVKGRVGVIEGARRMVSAAGGVGEEGEAGWVLETAEGELLEIPLSAQDGDLALPSPTLPSLPEFCPHLQHLLLPSSVPSSTSLLPALIALHPSGRLYVSITGASTARQLASDATSFALAEPDFLIYTTFSHEAKFVPLSSLTSSSPLEVHTESYRRAALSGSSGQNDDGGQVVKRAVERGARIVAVVPSSTNLVLQMPRGNLETVCPRPLVLRVVTGFLDNHRYRSAFLTSRRHRIDLNLLYDHSPASFRANIREFVDQVKEVEHLNLFLSGLKEEDVGRTMYRGMVPSRDGADKSDPSASKVNLVLDLVRRELETRDVFHYANSILTAHVRKQPPAYEDALKVLVQLKAKDAERAEDAVKYIIFLSDANKLFDLALGMYDFPLVLMIAQQSQKDPREYLPFLRALRALPLSLQRHKIDDHLGRHASALKNLAAAEREAAAEGKEDEREEKFEEVLRYAGKHGLWETAMEVYEGVEGRYETVLVASAEDLFDRSKYAEAALLFQLGNETDKALLSYQRAHAWQELFTLAVASGKKKEEVREMAVEVAESLVGKRRYAEAARVLLEYGEDVEASVQALCDGNLYAEAVRLTALHSRSDLLDSHIKPSTLEMQQRLEDDMSDLTEQLEKQVSRLAELRVKCEQNPYNYYCIDDPAAMLENVELAPDGMSDAGTAFTRYTAAPTTMASSTRKSSRTATSRRRQALKKAAGKKGSVYEEIYLLNSIRKTVEGKLVELRAEVSALLPILLTLRSPSHRSAALTLQSALSTFELFLQTTLSTIWDPLERTWRAEREEEQRVRDSGDPMRVQEWESRPRPVEGEEETKRVERPVWPKGGWRLGVVDAAARAEGL